MIMNGSLIRNQVASMLEQNTNNARCVEIDAMKAPKLRHLVMTGKKQLLLKTEASKLQQHINPMRYITRSVQDVALEMRTNLMRLVEQREHAFMKCIQIEQVFIIPGIQSLVVLSAEFVAI